MALAVDRIDHLVLNVRDAERSAAWYTQVLGMERADRDGRIAMWFGRQKLHLRPADASQEDWFTARLVSPGSDDLCFSTPSSPAEVQEHLTSCGVAIEVGPVQRDGSLGVMTSSYCRDPDGNLVEVASYEQGTDD